MELVDRGDPAGDAAAIDLGDSRWSDAEIGNRRLSLRWLVAVPALMALVAVLGLGGAAPQSPSMRIPLWTGSGGEFAMIGDVLVTVDRSGYISARDVFTGSERWRSELSTPVRVLDLGDAVGVTWIADPGRDDTASQSHTSVFDARSGAKLTTLDGFAMWYGSGVLVLSQDVARSPTCNRGDSQDQDGPACYHIVGVRPIDGTTVWDLVIPASARPTGGLYGLSRATIGIVDAAGHVVVRDLVTGSIRAEADVPEWHDSDVGTSGYAILADTAVSVHRVPQSDPPIAAVAGRAFDGHAQWSVEISVSSPIEDSEASLYPVPCGEWLCIYDGDSTTVFDPHSGRQLLTLGKSWAYPFGGLPLFARETLAGQGVQLLDPVTASIRAELEHLVAPIAGMTPGSWAVDRAGRQLATITPVAATASDVVAVGADGTVRRIGTIRRVESCYANQQVLICRHSLTAGPATSPDDATAALSVFRLPAYAV